MKLSEVKLADYPHKVIHILIPKNFANNRGATFPPDSDDTVLRLLGEQELAEENPVYLSEDGVILNIRLKNNISFY